MQRYFAVVLAVVLTGLYALPQTASPLSGAIEVIRPSVVQIRRNVLLPPSEREALHLEHNTMVLGTGFIIDVSNGYVVTALHVIEDGETPIKLPNGQPTHPLIDGMRIGIALPKVNSPELQILETFSTATFKVIGRDKRHDIAVLKADHPISDIGFLRTSTQDIKVHPKSASLFVGQLRDGESVAVSGYPFSSNVLLTTSGVVATSDAINTVEKQVPGVPA